MQSNKHLLKVLVTGAGGFIGKHAVTALYNAGYQVTGLYRTVTNRHNPWEYIEGDILDPNTQNILKRSGFDTIVHCAAVIPKQFKGIESERSAKLNRSIDDFILELSEKKPSKLIYLSGSSVYGTDIQGNYTEDSPVCPIGPYVASKLYTEQQIIKLNLNAVSLRVSAPYGPGIKRLTVIKLFIENALRGEYLTCHGSGQRLQDFIYIEDVADAIVCAASYQSKDVFNISGGNPITMRDLANLVVSCVPECTSKIISSGQPDPQENYRPGFDISKAEQKLNWQPKTDLRTGITKFIRSLQHQL